MAMFLSERLNALLQRDQAGHMLRVDMNAATDSRKRLDCYGAAAYYGVPAAQLEMARHLLKDGSPRIRNNLRQYIVEAAESGIPAAQVLLAECYEQGTLFPKNLILARHLREMASKR